MASTFSGKVNFRMEVSEVGDAVFGSSPSWAGAIGAALEFTHGITADKFDLAYIAERTVLTAATDSVDLRGALTSPLGIAMAAVELVALAIFNKQKDGTDNTTALTIGGGSNKIVGLYDSLVLPPGGFTLIAAGSAAGIAALAAGTADLLQVINAAGATNKYQLLALGRSA